MAEVVQVMRVRAELTPEEKERAMIDRKRAADEARRQRILDVRTRTMGIDTEYLKAQIAEKQRIAAAEKEREQVLDQRMLDNAENVEKITREIERIKKQEEYKVKQFQMTNQVKTSRREYDLSDPDRLKKQELPFDNLEKLGPSSFQIFDGTDMNAAERKSREAEQLRSWYQAGSDQKQAARQASKEEDTNYMSLQKSIDDRLQEVHSAVETMRTQQKVDTLTENKNLAQARAKYLEEQKALEVQTNLKEIETQLNSPFLSEDKRTTVNAYDPRRPVPYHFKGYSVDAKQQILDTQVLQAEEQNNVKEAIKQNEQDWAAYMENQRTTGLKIEREVQRIKQQQRVDLREELRRQAQQQKTATSEANKTFTSNSIDSSFFDQFGNSAR